MKQIRAVLFDVDGTLLDSNDAHAHAWVDALRGHGIDLPYDRVRTRIGMGGDKMLRELTGIEPGSVQATSLSERRVALMKACYLPNLGPFPGARMLLEQLRARGLKCAVVTSATAKDAPDLLRAAAVADLMDEVITSDDGGKSKPDPDLVQVALGRLELAADQALFVGDTPYDLEAAARAHVPMIAFRSGGWDDRALRNAIAIYDGPADLASNLDASPIFTEAEPAPAAARHAAGEALATTSSR